MAATTAAATVTEQATTLGVMLGILASLATVIVLLVRNGKMATTAARESTAANQAVNSIGPGEHSLREHIGHIRDDVAKLSKAQEDFHKKGWTALPADLNSAASFTATVRSMQHDLVEVKARVRLISKVVNDLAPWDGQTERRAYPRHERLEE